MAASIVSAKGWVVIPKEIRERHGIKQGTRVRFVDYGGMISLVLEPVDATAALNALYGKFADGPSLTEDLLRERAWELEQEEKDLDQPLRAG